MAAPSQPLLPSIFSLCDLSSLDDDPSWLPLEGTLSAVSCLGFAADSMFASDLDPLSGAACLRDCWLYANISDASPTLQPISLRVANRNQFC